MGENERIARDSAMSDDEQIVTIQVKTELVDGVLEFSATYIYDAVNGEIGDNEKIARAAGVYYEIEGLSGGRMPDWRTDPGAVATWLLPVLQKRWPDVVFFAYDERWNVSKSRFVPRWHTAPTFHEAVIFAILATGEVVNDLAVQPPLKTRHPGDPTDAHLINAEEDRHHGSDLL